MVDQTSDLNKIYCFGDYMKFLVFNIGSMQWQTMSFDNQSQYDGSLKYMACCSTPFADTQAYQRKIYLSGGVFNNNNHPSSMFFEISPKALGKPI